MPDPEIQYDTVLWRYECPFCEEGTIDDNGVCSHCSENHIPDEDVDRLD